MSFCFLCGLHYPWFLFLLSVCVLVNQSSFRKITAFLHSVLWSPGKQRGPRSKPDFNVETGDSVAPTHPEGVKRIVTHILRSLGRAGQKSHGAPKRLQRKRKGTQLFSKGQEISVGVDLETKESFCTHGTVN